MKKMPKCDFVCQVDRCNLSFAQLNKFSLSLFEKKFIIVSLYQLVYADGVIAAEMRNAFYSRDKSKLRNLQKVFFFNQCVTTVIYNFNFTNCPKQYSFGTVQYFGGDKCILECPGIERRKLNFNCLAFFVWSLISCTICLKILRIKKKAPDRK